MATLDDVVTAVAAEDTVVDSVVTLLTSLKTALDAAIASGLHAAMAHVRLTQWLASQGKSLADASAEASAMLGGGTTLALP